MDIQFHGGQIASELKAFVAELKEKDFDFSNMQMDQDRMMITSQFISLVNLYCNHNPSRAKKIRSGSRDLIVSVVEAISNDILSPTFHIDNNLSHIHSRLVKSVQSFNGSSETTLLNIVRTFTGVTFPFSAAQHCSWLTEDILNIFCEVAFVRSEWLMNGNLPKAPFLPMGYESPLIINDQISDSRLRKKESIGYVIYPKSCISESFEAMVLITQSIVNESADFTDPVKFIKPILRTDDKEKLIDVVEGLANEFIPFHMSETSYMDYQEAITGTRLLTELVAKSKMIPGSKNLLHEL